MIKQIREKRLRSSAVVIIALAMLIVFSMMLERWVVFLPYGFTVNLKMTVFAICIASFLLLCLKSIRGGYHTTPRSYVVMFFGSILFSWCIMEAVYGDISATNAIFSNQRKILCLHVVSNLNAPEGAFSRTHTIHVVIAGDPTGIKAVRYRYPEIDFGGLASGDSVQVLAKVGWAGYSLEKVVTRDRCQRSEPGAVESTVPPIARISARRQE